MSMLSPEDLENLAPAESLFASPIPVQSVSSDEFMPLPQTAKQQEFEARIRETGASMLAKAPAAPTWPTDLLTRENKDEN